MADHDGKGMRLLVIIIPLSTIEPKRDTDYVFKQLNDLGGYPSQSFSFMVGILDILWTYVSGTGQVGWNANSHH
jgi:hypothetical protein